MDTVQSQNPVNSTTVPSNTDGGDSKPTYLIIGLGLALLLALIAVGYLVSRCYADPCDKTCPDSSNFVCPQGFTIGCDKCTGKNYCSETPCATDTDCASSPYAKSQSRNKCIKTNTTDTTGQCRQCSDSVACPKGFNCVRGWCVQCLQDSDCNTTTWDAKAQGKCTNEACVFTADGCNTAATTNSSLTGVLWPYNTGGTLGKQLICPLKQAAAS